MLLKPCELILADEPTGSLDVENKQIIYELLDMLRKKGKTILVVSHDQDTIQRAERMVAL